MLKRWFYKIMPYRILPILILILQMILVGVWIVTRSRESQIAGIILNVISVIVALYIVSKRDKGAYKLTWVFLILFMPLFGGFVYLMFNFQTSTRRFAKKIENGTKKATEAYLWPGNQYETAVSRLPEYTAHLSYMQNFAGFPVYGQTATKYLTPGENAFAAMLEEMRKAEKYIFLEFFIVEEGVMWDAIFEVLKEKAAAGVQVRLIYDDLGCFFLLPPHYPKKLKEYGIECVPFNPFMPFLTAVQNNRDHRKILVVDGKVAFTGGINLADEYINVVEKHGHWKDSAVKVCGHAAWSFTMMFLQTWELCTGKDEAYEQFYPWQDEPCEIADDGLVLPYADSPMDDENVGEHVYLQIINSARQYVYITTPYLIIDDSMVSALTLAAKSGIDIRIITPHKWDKWLVHMTTRSYYRELIKSGVKIYEYTNGFIHSKTFVSDDKVATVGTINLDFRSLYLHFECGACIYNSRAVDELKQDILAMLPNCKEITLQDCKCSLLTRLFQDVLRLIAPIL